MLKCKGKDCDGDLMRISDWDAREILGEPHLGEPHANNKNMYLGNYLLCEKCHKLHRVKITDIKVRSLRE